MNTRDWLGRRLYPELYAKLDAVLQNQSVLFEQGRQLMALGAETQKVVDALNTASNVLATRIQTLVDATDMTAEEKAAFAPIIANLQAMGVDPNAPIPPPPPPNPVFAKSKR